MLMHMPSNIYSLTQDILFHVQFKKKIHQDVNTRSLLCHAVTMNLKVV